MNHTASHRVLSLLLAVLFTPLETAALPRAGHVPAASTSREARRAGPVTVAVGSTGGEARARQLFAHALEQAIAQHPALRLQPAGFGAAIVVNAEVRSLTVLSDINGAQARCDVGVVIADGTGAVRATVDARRTIRGAQGQGEALERSALQHAADGVVRDLVAQMVR